ncbi:MAG: efflux RND transporter periplasmic adaptor subunit [Thermodesulfovibrionales bacterium]|jgi:HlyD family secretion protein
MKVGNKMKKVLIVSAVVIILAIAAYFFLRGNNNEPQFRTEKVVKGDIVMAVTATGTVNPVTTVLVGTQVSGTIKEIYVDYNSPVRKGQLIARIDPAPFEAQVDQAKANLLSAQANLVKATATRIDANRTMLRNKELFAKDLIARSDLDTAETNDDTAVALESAAKSQIAQTKAALKLVDTNLQYTRIISPVDGVVISRNVDVGQTVAASFQTPTLFTIAQDLTKMQIDTSVDESDIGNIKVSQDVEFIVDAYPDSTFKGRVWQIRNAPITVQNVVTYDVVIKVDNPELKLKPGMTANVSIIISTKKDVLKIPNAVLRFRLSEKGAQTSEKKGPGVWILEKGKPRRVHVTAGISDGSFTELLSGDIREGQELIVESLVKAKASGPAGPRMF